MHSHVFAKTGGAACDLSIHFGLPDESLVDDSTWDGNYESGTEYCAQWQVNVPSTSTTLTRSTDATTQAQPRLQAISSPLAHHHFPTSITPTAFFMLLLRKGLGFPLLINLHNHRAVCPEFRQLHFPNTLTC